MLLKGQKVHDTLINHSVRKIVVFFLAVEEGGGGVRRIRIVFVSFEKNGRQRKIR